MDKKSAIIGIKLVKKHLESQIGIWTNSGIPPEMLIRMMIYNLNGLSQCIEDETITENDIVDKIPGEHDADAATDLLADALEVRGEAFVLHGLKDAKLTPRRQMIEERLKSLHSKNDCTCREKEVDKTNCPMHREFGA